MEKINEKTIDILKNGNIEDIDLDQCLILIDLFYRIQTSNITFIETITIREIGIDNLISKIGGIEMIIKSINRDKKIDQIV